MPQGLKDMVGEFEGTLILFAGWWCGCAGIVPGSASGTQSVESFHSTWNKCSSVAKAGAPAHEGLAVMQSLYKERLSDTTPTNTRVSMAETSDVNPHLLHDTNLSQHGFYSAGAYWTQRSLPNHVVLEDDPSGAVVAVSAQANKRVNET